MSDQKILTELLSNLFEVDVMEPTKQENPSEDVSPNSGNPENLENSENSENSIEMYLSAIRQSIESSIGPLLGDISQKIRKVAPMNDVDHESVIDQRVMKLDKQKQELVSLINSIKKDLQQKNARISLDLQEMKKSLESLQSKNSNLNRMDSAQQIIQDVIPIGFIYTQLPFQKSSEMIWPWAAWQEITSNYSGYFFRAEGGNSEPFGKAQADAIIYHQHAVGFGLRFTNMDSDLYFVIETNVSQPLGDPLNRFFIKRNVETMMLIFDETNKEYDLRETRPLNYAMKIWIRQS